jgi:Tfp pilus assembly protein PilO
MYAKRNSLTILAFLLLLSGVGFFWYRSEAKDLARVSAKNKELTMQLRGALEVAETLAYVTAERDSLQRLWKKSPKKILNTEEPAFSLSYINWLIRTHNLALDFDFYLNDKKAKNEYTVFTYTLSGEGDYRNFCTLVWHMTRNPLLYHIKSVTMRRSDNDPKLVSFNVTFEGYSMNKDWEVKREVAMTAASFDWEAEFRHDSFESMFPVVIEPKPEPKVASRPVVEAPPPKPKEPPGLLEVETATLLAITNDKAYLRAKDGKVVPLKIGDQVRHGRLTRLEPSRNQAEFVLESESGSSRIFQLTIEYN